jgi:hypothetical protein
MRASSSAFCGSSGAGCPENWSSRSCRRVLSSSRSRIGSSLRDALIQRVMPCACSALALAAAASCSGVMSVSLAQAATEAAT